MLYPVPDGMDGKIVAEISKLLQKAGTSFCQGIIGIFSIYW